MNGVRSILYNGTCVKFAGDAWLNSQPGYTYTFAACDLSVLGTGIGTFSIIVTGPPLFLYQKSATLTSGSVSIYPQLAASGKGPRRTGPSPVSMRSGVGRDESGERPGIGRGPAPCFGTADNRVGALDAEPL